MMTGLEPTFDRAWMKICQTTLMSAVSIAAQADIQLFPHCFFNTRDPSKPNSIWQRQHLMI